MIHGEVRRSRVKVLVPERELEGVIGEVHEARVPGRVLRDPVAVGVDLVPGVVPPDAFAGLVLEELDLADEDLGAQTGGAVEGRREVGVTLADRFAATENGERVPALGEIGAGEIGVDVVGDVLCHPVVDRQGLFSFGLEPPGDFLGELDDLGGIALDFAGGGDVVERVLEDVHERALVFDGVASELVLRARGQDLEIVLTGAIAKGDGPVEGVAAVDGVVIVIGLAIAHDVNPDPFHIVLERGGRSDPDVSVVGASDEVKIVIVPPLGKGGEGKDEAKEEDKGFYVTWKFKSVTKKWGVNWLKSQGGDGESLDSYQKDKHSEALPFIDLKTRNQ